MYILIFPLQLVVTSLKEQQKKSRLSVAKFEGIIEALKDEERELKALTERVQRKAGKFVDVPLSRLLSNDRAPFDTVFESNETQTAEKRKRGRPVGTTKKSKRTKK